MSRGFDISVGSISTDQCLDSTPRHSTPKTKDSLEEYSINEHTPISEVDHLRQLLAQRDNEFATLLKAYENVLLAWQQEKKGNNLGKPYENINLQNIDRTSVLSESSKDSGRLTESPVNPLEALTDSLAVLELIKDLAKQLQDNEKKLEQYESSNLHMINQIKDLSAELEVLKQHQMHCNVAELSAENKTLKSVIRTLENDHAKNQDAEERLTQDLNIWKESYNDARLEIENLKREIVRLEKELEKATKGKEHLKQKIQKMQDNQMKIEARDETRSSTLVEHQHALRKLNLALSTVKMLLDKQVNVVHMCLQSIAEHNTREKRSSDLTPSKKKPSARQMEMLLQTFLENVKTYKETSESEASVLQKEPKKLQKNADHKKDKGSKATFKNSVINGESVNKQTGSAANSLDLSVKSVCSEETLMRLNRMLTASQEVLTRMSMFD